jgi:hypothetical protein
MDLKIGYNDSVLTENSFYKPADNMEIHNPLQGRNNGNNSSPGQVYCLYREINI